MKHKIVIAPSGARDQLFSAISTYVLASELASRLTDHEFIVASAADSRPLYGTRRLPNLWPLLVGGTEEFDRYLDEASLLLDLQSLVAVVPWLKGTTAQRIDMSQLPTDWALDGLSLLALTHRWFRSEFLEHARIPPAPEDAICIYGDAINLPEVRLEVGRLASLENLSVLLLEDQSQEQRSGLPDLNPFEATLISHLAPTAPESLVGECRAAKIVVATCQQALAIAESFGTPAVHVSNQMSRTDVHRSLDGAISSGGDRPTALLSEVSNSIDSLAGLIAAATGDSPEVKKRSNKQDALALELVRVEVEVLKERILLERQAFNRSLSVRQSVIDEVRKERDEAIEEQQRLRSVQRIQAAHMNKLEAALADIDGKPKKIKARRVWDDRLPRNVGRLRGWLLARRLK